MNRNRDHANRPTRITNGDRERMRLAVARGDEARARAKRRERVAAFAVTVGGAVALLAIFIAATGGF